MSDDGRLGAENAVAAAMLLRALLEHAEVNGRYLYIGEKRVAYLNKSEFSLIARLRGCSSDISGERSEP